MAKIKIQDLTSIIQDFSEHELELQGGCGRTFTIRLPSGRVVIAGMDLCLRLPPDYSLYNYR